MTYKIVFLDNSWGNADIVSETPLTGNLADAKAAVAFTFTVFTQRLMSLPNLADIWWNVLTGDYAGGFNIEYQLTDDEMWYCYGVVLEEVKEMAS